jgi:ATP-dependent RNA helicase RhlE
LSFEDFKLGEKVLMGLSDMGFSNPTPIQNEAIPIILDGNDILASAQTGTGKTAAFAIPILNKLSENPGKGIRALILAPTRELAGQIDEQFWSIGYHCSVPSACIYGGSDWGVQEKAIREGVNVIVATPGRLLDHIKVSTVDFSKLEFLVLDEADRMLDMGFIPDVRSIIMRLPKVRQTLLFSATISDRIESLADELTVKPVRINVSSFKPAEGVTQQAFKVDESQKLDLVLRIFDGTEVQSAIVFTSTKRGADSLSRALHKKGVRVAAMHGDRDQKDRELTLADFKAGRINVIVATDVMARGIDITGVSHVVNFNVPHDVDDYIHRIGRTARAEMTGTAITLVSPQDARYFQAIMKEMKDRITLLDLPDGILAPNPDAPASDGRRGNDRRGGPPRRSESSSGDKRNGERSRNDIPRDRPAQRVQETPKPEVLAAVAPQVESDTVGSDQTDSASSPRPARKRPPRRKRPAAADGASAPRDGGEVRAPREGRDNRGPREDRAPREGRDNRGPREDRAPREGRDYRGPREDRAPREGRDNRDSRTPRAGSAPKGVKPADATPESIRRQRIQNVTKPFRDGAGESPKSDAKSEPKGLWGKISSLFGKKD